jgi:hypothetical protein
LRTQHDNPDREARAPRALSTKPRAVDAGALVGGAGPRPADPLGPGEMLQLQRSTGNATVARLLGRQRSQITLQRSKESEELLTKLATPKVGEGQASEVQTQLADDLETLVSEKWSKEEDRPVELNIGGILIDRIPNADKTYMPTGGNKPEDKQQRRRDVQNLYEQLAAGGGEGAAAPAVQFVGLDTTVPGARSTGVKFGGNVKGKPGLGAKVVENTLKTMLDAEQFEYLRLAGLPNEEWKILVELHYVRARPKDMAGFHKDTQGQSLFVNLNYHVPGYKVRGPEYVLNPPRSEAHDRLIYGTTEKEGTLPKEFTRDLTKVREVLPEPTWIESAGTVEELGYVAFVDEAVHHATPWFEGRYVTPSEFKAYLERKHKAQFDEIVKANKDYSGSRWPSSWYPFSTYVKKDVIPEGEVAKWTTWLAMATVSESERSKAKRETRYTRKEFAATMQAGEFERMLEDVGSQPYAARDVGGAGGWFAASIPKASLSDVKEKTKPPLERRASKTEVTKDWPPQLPEKVKRRFIRSWVRAVPKSFADSVRNS